MILAPKGSVSAGEAVLWVGLKWGVYMAWKLGLGVAGGTASAFLAGGLARGYENGVDTDASKQASTAYHCVWLYPEAKTVDDDVLKCLEEGGVEGDFEEFDAVPADVFDGGEPIAEVWSYARDRQAEYGLPVGRIVLISLVGGGAGAGAGAWLGRRVDEAR
jgi:hypothetical protein